MGEKVNGKLEIEELRRHLELLMSGNQDHGKAHTSVFLEDIRMAPLFTWDVKHLLRQQAAQLKSQCKIPATAFDGEFKQYSLLGQEVPLRRLLSPAEKSPNSKAPKVLSTSKANQTPVAMKPIYLNTDAPFSTFVCGSQGSGKSHTLSCIIENCLLSTHESVNKIGKLPQPAAGIVFHFDPHGGICEAAHLSSAGIPVRVLLKSRSQLLRNAYKAVSTGAGLAIENFSLQYEHLNVENMLELMGFDETENMPPLYLTEVVRILRDIYDQSDGDTFTQREYLLMKAMIDTSNLTEAQRAPLKLRFLNLESYLPRSNVPISQGKGKGKRKTLVLDDFLKATPGVMTIIDLSDPFTTPSMACTLFRMCLNLFLRRNSPNDSVGRLVALDEAHKYMQDTPSAAKFTEALLAAIRMQRHVGARIIVSTQEPTISHKLLDLCSMTIVHRFTSPDWFNTLRHHVAGLSVAGGVVTGDTNEIFSTILGLGVGEALLFSPSALLRIYNGKAVKIGNDYIKVKIRPRISNDGGRSLFALQSD